MRLDILKQIQELCELTKIDDYRYAKMIQSGNLVDILNDYDKGYYDVSMCCELFDNKYHVRVIFQTIDDGDFGSCNIFETEKYALNLLNKIVEKFKDMIICPRYYDLNNHFRDIGVYFI